MYKDAVSGCTLHHHLWLISTEVITCMIKLIFFASDALVVGSDRWCARTP